MVGLPFSRSIAFVTGLIIGCCVELYGQSLQRQTPSLVSLNHGNSPNNNIQPWLSAVSQEPNYLAIRYQGQSDSLKIHSPKKATIMALTLPGSGQIYNRKYWKVPIVYAGLGGSIYAIGRFRGNMKTLNDSISRIYAMGKTPSAQLIQDRDNQRSRRDVAILCLTGVYVLQVLDAVVDAHFYKFNINDKIAVEWNPSPTRMMSFRYQL